MGRLGSLAAPKTCAFLRRSLSNNALAAIIVLLTINRLLIVQSANIAVLGSRYSKLGECGASLVASSSLVKIGCSATAGRLLLGAGGQGYGVCLACKVG